MPLPDPDSANCVSETISQLMDEGYSQDQATAIAMDHCKEASSMADEGTENTKIYKQGLQSEEDPFTFVLSTNSVDRAGDIVEQDFNLTAFRKNPIALWGHDSKMPIGTWGNLRKETVGTVKRTLGRLNLAQPGTSKFIDFLRSMVEQRILKAVSVGILPREYEPLDEDDPWGGLRLSKNELMECSLCSVPMNAEALSLAKSAGSAVNPTFLAELGEPIVFDSAAEQLGIKKSRDSGIKPPQRVFSNRDTTRSKKMPMSLSDKIVAKQDSLTVLRDQLTELMDTGVGEDGIINDETQTQMDELTRSIEIAEKNLDSLKRAEAALTLKAAAAQSDKETVERGTPGTPLHARAQRIEAKKLRPKGFNQMATFAVMLASHVQRRSPLDIAKEQLPDEPELDYVLRAAVAPADVATDAWAGNLVRDSWTEFLDLLRDVSIYPALPGTRAQFDRAGRLIVPRNEGRGQLAGGFIGELAPIPVKGGTIGTTDLTPKKMAVISPYSKELGRQSVPQIQSVITDQILGDTAEALDSAYLGNGARTAEAPAGLQDPTETGAPNIVASGGLNTVAEINSETKAMISRFLQSRSGKNAVWIMNPLRTLGLSMVQDAASGAFPYAAQIAAGTFQKYPYVESQNVPEDVVYLQSNGAMTYGDAFAPIIEVDDTSTLIMDDAPEATIGDALTATQVVNSLFQIDGVAVKMTLGLDWRITRGGGSVQVLTGVGW